tara:strand:+ start:320 stop:559 length:240 start_codon:yes stop_codon:yes gene_type:complete
MMKVDESFDRDPMFKKSYFFNQVEKTIKTALDKELADWGVKNPVWSKPLRWFIERDETQKKFKDMVLIYQNHYWDWWMN